MKKKKSYAIILIICLILVNSISVFASGSTENMENVYKFIFSEETNRRINEKIDFNAYGTQSIDLGNGITYIYQNTHNLTRSTKSETMSSIFKLNDQTVATLRLACTFTYTGSSVSIKSSNYKATADAIPNWSCTSSATDSKDSSGDVYVSATYELYKDGNYNANSYMDMSCDKNGNVTKHYPWS